MMSKRAAFILVFFLFILPLWAQATGSTAANTDESRYDRLFSWDGDEYTLRYEVIVEKEEGEAYRIAARRFTTDPVLRLSLTQGNYRFRVIPYDLLNKPGKSSDWITFEVHSALVAELPKTEEPINEIPEIEEITEIEAVKETASAKLRKAFDIYVNLSWMPVIPAHFYDENPFFTQSPSFIGGGISLGLVYDQSAYINAGMEFSVSWLTLDGFYDPITQKVITFEFDLLAQKWFPKRIFALSYRLGIGISIPDIILTINDYKEEWYSHNVNIGVSLLCRPAEHFYLEAGIKYVYLSWPASGYFRPSLGIGLRS